MIFGKNIAIYLPLPDFSGGGRDRNQMRRVLRKDFCNYERVIGKGRHTRISKVSKNIVLHTDESNLQLGLVISQENCTIAFYSKKSNSVQCRYTAAEKQLLSIIETLKEFKYILLGYII